MTDALPLLTLLQVPRLGRRSADAILRKYPTLPPDAAGLCDAIAAARAEYRHIPQVTADDLAAAREKAERLLEAAGERRIAAVPRGHADFPAHLNDIPDPPVLLWARGDIGALRRRDAIAIIGTREPTEYGQRMAERLGAFYGGRGVVVSGLALGCDAAAHRGCLSRSGVTIAFLAHGLDRIYPAENAALAEEIVGAGGCLVSEYAVGESPRRNYFVERDRLQSGQSRAVLVIETDTDGGTMHTVRFCEEQGRILACLQHPPAYQDQPKIRGNRALIAEGRGLAIQDANDLEALWERIRSANPPAAERVPSAPQASQSPETPQGQQLALFEEA